MQPTAPGGRRPLDGPQAPAAGLHAPTQLLLLSPKADTHFTVPRKVGGIVSSKSMRHRKMVSFPTSPM